MLLDVDTATWLTLALAVIAVVSACYEVLFEEPHRKSTSAKGREEMARSIAISAADETVGLTGRFSDWWEVYRYVNRAVLRGRL